MDGWMDEWMDWQVLRKDIGPWSLTGLGLNAGSVTFSGTGVANFTPFSLHHFYKESTSMAMVPPQPPVFAHWGKELTSGEYRQGTGPMIPQGTPPPADPAPIVN